MQEQLLLEVRDMRKYFEIRGGLLQRTVNYVRAVDGINISIKKGETLGLVGESGCGKTTTGRVILHLVEGASGEVLFRGRNLLELNKKEIRTVRRNMQMVFQDPYSSLNPRMTVRDIIGEPLLVHGICRGQELRDRVLKLMKMVGLEEEHLSRYAHEFSGGQRQRIGIARALALEPALIVLDEPTSSLDVSVQSQILNLLTDLQSELGLTYLFISHDLSVIKHMSTRIAVMYLGKIVEIASKEDLFKEPLHPYTQALLSAVPVPNPHYKKPRIMLHGEVPSPSSPPPGCAFHTRCPHVMDVCKEREPELIDVGNEHFVACHLVGSPLPNRL
jgi:oligopeptide/dipeptide ABC transporter ATP-binding protein